MIDIVILNYKNYSDTLELYKSIIDSKKDIRISTIYIVDNNSENNSIDFIKDEINNLNNLYAVKYISSNINLGYAGGNNLAINKFMEGDSKYILICNNDLFFPKEQLSKFIDSALLEFSSSSVGLVGSVLRYYDFPSKIQASGGKINNFFCKTKHLNEGLNNITDLTQPDYPIGALLFISRKTIEIVGLLNEEYFLYYEELDYVNRMRNKGFDFRIVDSSTVLHKEGASAGSNSRDYKSVSLISDYYLNINKIIYSKKHNRKKLIFVYITVFLNALRRLFRGELKKSSNIIKFLLGIKH